MIIEKSPEFLLAEQWINETQQNIFLTGKAGTGKTTLLHHIKTTSPKTTAVLAPTGVAAINAGGSTIHSFFKLPLLPFVPSTAAEWQQDGHVTPLNLFGQLRYNRQQLHLLRTVELIIIDEVSMVRADLMDMLDCILRHFRRAEHLPFGGVQMLFIGDMHQLPPVVKRKEERLLAGFYPSPYFFHSKVLMDYPPVSVELKKIYRQQDAQFITILNELRQNELTEDTYHLLAEKVQTRPPADDKYITLTSHVAKAAELNKAGMAKLTTPVFFYNATVHGDFGEHLYPCAEVLELKEGARVMFNKNDPGKKFYNGKTGVVTRTELEEVWVKTDDGETIKVEPLAWVNTKYKVSEQSGNMEEQVLGEFIQMPLSHAWAVTIHKSQGLTFDFVVIDAEKSFASGQVYVALSRCRTLEGIVLLSQIHPKSLFTDLNIVRFGEQIWKTEKLENALPGYKHQFQSEALINAFDLHLFQKDAQLLKRVGLEYEQSFSAMARDWIQNLLDHIFYITDVSRKFITQIEKLNELHILPSNNKLLCERIKQAAQFFEEKNNEHLILKLTQLPDAPDNAQAATRTLKILESIRELALVHQRQFSVLQNSWTTSSVLRARSKALIDLSKMTSLKWRKVTSGSEIYNGDSLGLIAELKAWRAQKAEQENLPAYRILSNKTIDGMAASMPDSLNALLKVEGIGPKKITAYGRDLLDIMDGYVKIKESVQELQWPDSPKTKKQKSEGDLSATSLETLEWIEKGETIETVAHIRNLSPSTIRKHIEALVLHRRLKAQPFIEPDFYLRLKQHLADADLNQSLTALREQIGEWATYEDLRLIKAELQSELKTT